MGTVAEEAAKAAMQKKLASMEKDIARLKGIASKVTTAEIKLMASVDDVLSRATGQYKEMLAMQHEFMQNTGQFFDDFQEKTKGAGAGVNEYSKAFATMADFGLKFFGDVKEGVKPMADLTSGMNAFIFANNQTQINMGKTAAVFRHLGMDTKVLGEVMDSAMLAFGKTGEEAVKMSNKIMGLSKAFVMKPTELATNFRSAQKNLAYDSDKLMTVFTKLQFTSRRTGISFDTLTGQFGDSMDTFEGSASKAGNLNALLGRSVFNSIDLLGKTEAERVETIVKGIQKNVNVEAMMKNKFQLKAFAKQLGLSPEDTRRLLTGRTSIPDVLAKGKTKDPKEQALSAMANAAKRASVTFEDLIPTVMQLRSAMQNFVIQANYTLQKGLEGALSAATGMEGVQSLYQFSEVFELMLAQGDMTSWADYKKKQGEKATFQGFLKQIKSASHAAGKGMGKGAGTGAYGPQELGAIGKLRAKFGGKKIDFESAMAIYAAYRVGGAPGVAAAAGLFGDGKKGGVKDSRVQEYLKSVQKAHGKQPAGILGIDKKIAGSMGLGPEQSRLAKLAKAERAKAERKQDLKDKKNIKAVATATAKAFRGTLADLGLEVDLVNAKAYFKKIQEEEAKKSAKKVN